MKCLNVASVGSGPFLTHQPCSAVMLVSPNVKSPGQVFLLHVFIASSHLSSDFSTMSPHGRLPPASTPPVTGSNLSILTLRVLWDSPLFPLPQVLLYFSREGFVSCLSHWTICSMKQAPWLVSHHCIPRSQQSDTVMCCWMNKWVWRTGFESQPWAAMVWIPLFSSVKWRYFCHLLGFLGEK